MRAGRSKRLALLLAALAVAGPVVAQVVNPDPAVKAIMDMGVNPGALAFWAGGNEAPENETPLQAQARWTGAVEGARTLQAQGVQLQAHSRPGRWNEYAQLLADTAREGEAAALAKDADKAFEIGGRLYDSCNGCHKTYIPTPARLP